MCKNVDVENSGDAWHRATAKRVGEAVANRRKELGMTAQQLAERCKSLGVSIHRTTITKIENGRPRFDLGELIVLAAALEVPAVALIYPDLPDGEVEVLPEQWISSIGALLRFTGEMEADPGSDLGRLAQLSRERFIKKVRHAAALDFVDERVKNASDADAEQISEQIFAVIDKADELRDLNRRIREIPGSTVNDDI